MTIWILRNRLSAKSIQCIKYFLHCLYSLKHKGKHQVNFTIIKKYNGITVFFHLVQCLYQVIAPMQDVEISTIDPDLELSPLFINISSNL